MLKLQVLGTLGKDAEVREVNGKKVINFSIAHNEKYKDAQGNQQEKTVWVECAKWGESTGIAPYLKKGTKVWVDGNPSIKQYQKQDGTTASSFGLQVLAIELLGSNQQQPNAAAPVQTQSSPLPDNIVDIDSLPW
jgi:single-strand DNA-binding protein